MKLKLLLVIILTSFVLTNVNAQEINPKKYNKLIKKEKYAEALNFLKDKDFPTDNYWFSSWGNQFTTFALDKNFTDDMYNTIITLVNYSYANIDYPKRAAKQVGFCYITKALHYVWLGDFEKAETAFKDAQVSVEKFKKEKNIKPEYINKIKGQMAYVFYSELEFHKLYKKFSTMDINSLPYSEQELNQLKEHIKAIGENLNKPKKPHMYSNSTTSPSIDDANRKLATIPLVNYQIIKKLETFFFNMTSEHKNKYFPDTNLNLLFGDEFATKEQVAQNTEKRKKDLIKNYGKKYGESIFNGKIIIGMTKKMLEDEFNEPRSKESFSKYYEYWTWSNIMVGIDRETNKVASITEL